MNEIKNPESVGLVFNLMARYAEGKSENEFDKAVAAALGNDPAVKQTVRQIVEAMRKKPEVMRILPKEVGENPTHLFQAVKYQTAFRKLNVSFKSENRDNDGNPHERVDPPPHLEVRHGTSAPDIRIFYRGLKCITETSDGSASDEPYLITSVVDSNSNVHTVKHPFGEESYTDVDAGEKRVGPEVAIYNGKAQDLTIIGVMMEHDFGDPNHFRGAIDSAVKAAAAAFKVGTGISIPEAVTDLFADVINLFFGSEDDIIGQASKFCEKANLIAWSKAPLKTKEKETLYGKEIDMPAAMGYHFRTWHNGDGGAYRAYYQVREGK